MPQDASPIHFELVVLGSGAGASYLYDQLPSSSFMLLANKQPFCLIDLGLGVSHQVLAQFKAFPQQIIITHNHSDHAGELPVIARVELSQGRQLQIFAEQNISRRLQDHRMAEHHQLLAPSDIADWHAPQIGQKIPLSHGLDIAFYPGIHSELSCGFVLYQQDTALLSYTGDSQLNAQFYTLLNKAHTFIMDARPTPNPWHADFDGVRPWLTQNRHILGHGIAPKNRALPQYASLSLLFTGDRLDLTPPTLETP